MTSKRRAPTNRCGKDVIRCLTGESIWPKLSVAVAAQLKELRVQTHSCDTNCTSATLLKPAVTDTVDMISDVGEGQDKSGKFCPAVDCV